MTPPLLLLKALSSPPHPAPVPPHSVSLWAQAHGVRDILAVDVAPAMLAELQKRFPAPSALGNDPCVRTWLGDIVDLPAYQVGLTRRLACRAAQPWPPSCPWAVVAGRAAQPGLHPAPGQLWRAGLLSRGLHPA